MIVAQNVLLFRLLSKNLQSDTFCQCHSVLRKRLLIERTGLVAPVSCNETENNDAEESGKKQCGSVPLVLSLSCLSVKETYTAYYSAVGRQLQFESSPDSKRLR